MRLIFELPDNEYGGGDVVYALDHPRRGILTFNRNFERGRSGSIASPPEPDTIEFNIIVAAKTDSNKRNGYAEDE